MRNDGLFHILTFLDSNEITNLFKTKNRKLCTYINEALANAYFLNIKECLWKFNNVIELLKCTIKHSKIKDNLKIDLF